MALHLAGRLYMTIHRDQDETLKAIKAYPKLFCFSNEFAESYEPLCSDFGPVDLAAVTEFCRDLRAKRDHPSLKRTNRPLVFYTFSGEHDVANTCFLLGAHLVLDEGHTPEAAAALFDCLDLPAFRDATYSERNAYPLTILDALRGLRRAVTCGWYDQLTYSAAEHWSLGDTRALDLSRVSPKFAALSCPPPQAAPHAQSLAALGVSDLVRLNFDAPYAPADFGREGVSVHDLSFRDCTCPAPSVVARFLTLCDAARGVVGVHCLAGLGRTGTLIGCYLIKNHGFSAAEAIAYMRLCRPGSVIGRQQQFLEDVAAAEWAGNTPILPDTAARWAPALAVVGGDEGDEGEEPEGSMRDDDEASELATQVSDALQRRKGGGGGFMGGEGGLAGGLFALAEETFDIAG